MPQLQPHSEAGADGIFCCDFLTDWGVLGRKREAKQGPSPRVRAQRRPSDTLRRRVGMAVGKAIGTF